MILFVLPRLSGGGAERVLLNLMSRLHRGGGSVELLVLDYEGPLLSLVPHDLPLHDLSTGSLRHSLWPLIRKIRALRPKVIFSSLGYVNLVLLGMRPVLTHKIKIWIREANLPSISLRNNRYPWLMWQGYRHLYRHADRLLVSSERMKMEFIEIFNVPKERLYLLPNPVDEQIIRSKAAKIQRILGEGVRFVAAGRLTYQKGFDRLLHWFAEHVRKDDHLTILGDGELMSELQQLVITLKIEHHVSLEGFVENPWSWYAGADVLLMPSRWEGMPNTALEALACGTSVIATSDSGGISEVAAQTIDGVVTVVESKEDFIRAMINVKPSAIRSIRSSMLPDIYRIESVVSKFGKLYEYD